MLNILVSNVGDHQEFISIRQTHFAILVAYLSEQELRQHLLKCVRLTRHILGFLSGIKTKLDHLISPANSEKNSKIYNSFKELSAADKGKCFARQFSSNLLVWIYFYSNIFYSYFLISFIEIYVLNVSRSTH